MAINKNNDDIYIEIAELNWDYAHTLENKAHDIITAKERPERISESPIYRKCKQCAFAGYCHLGEKPKVNCRSCRLAEAVDGGQWFCSRYQSVIPQDVILKGCEGHTPL